MRLRTQIALLFMLPFAGILLVTVMGLQAPLREWREMRQLDDLLSPVEIVSALVHELQVERGLSAGYAASDGENFADSLAPQRRRVDELRASLEQNATQLVDFPETEALLTDLQKIERMRADVSGLRVTTPDLVAFYTRLIEDGLALNVETFSRARQGEIALPAASLALLGEAKELAGRQRALGAVGFGQGNFSIDLRDRFLELETGQAVLLDKAAERLPGTDFEATPERLARAPFLDAIRSAGVAENPGDLSAEAWFETSTGAIGALRQAEIDLLATIYVTERALAEMAFRRVVVFSGIAGLSILVTLIGVYFFTRRFGNQIGRLRGAMEAVAARSFETAIPETEDRSEIGALARALAAMRDDLQAGQIEIDKHKQLIAAISSQQAIVEFDTKGQILAANQNFCDAMEYAEAEVVGRHHRILVRDEFAGTEAYRQMWRTLGEGVPTTGLFERVTKGHNTVWLQGSYCPVRDEAGDITRIVKMITDRTAEENARIADLEARKAMREDLALVVNGLNKALCDLAEGDLTVRIETAFAEDYEALRGNFNLAIERLEECITSVVDNAAAMRGESGQLASAANQLAQRTENQAAALEETAAALEELTTSVGSTAEAAEAASIDVAGTRQAAVGSGRVVKKAVRAMGRIEKSSEKIGKIIGVIEDIAFQTNLLALNAGVEAARAGDAGRGFAVVASEVQALATRSADAAKEINALISTSSRQVGTGVGLVDKTGEALETIVEAVTAVTALVDGIASSAREQSVGISEINTAMTQLDQVTQQNAAMVEETNAASQAMRSEAEALAGNVAQFKIGTAAAAAASKGRMEARPVSDAASATGARRGRMAGNAALADEPNELIGDWEQF